MIQKETRPCLYCNGTAEVADILVAGRGTVYRCTRCGETFDSGDIAEEEGGEGTIDEAMAGLGKEDKEQ